MRVFIHQVRSEFVRKIIGTSVNTAYDFDILACTSDPLGLYNPLSAAPKAVDTTVRQDDPVPPHRGVRRKDGPTVMRGLRRQRTSNIDEREVHDPLGTRRN